MIAKNKFYISVFIIWLFNISGILGILSSNAEWFLKLTPLNLAIYFLLLLWNIKELSVRFIAAALIPFLLGFVAEFLGVNYDLIFGSYDYGENLGFKVGGVPIMICVNWIVLTMITADISKYIHTNFIVKSFIGGLLMMLLDIVIEISAPRFDFWEFTNGIVPIQNYIGWLVVAFVAHLGYNQFSVKSNQKFSVHVFVAIAVFFLTFLVY